MKKVYIFLAEGFEEIEAVTPADIMRRAGIEVQLVSCTGKTAVRGAHGVAYECDVLLEDVCHAALPDGVVLPGGMPGAVNLAENSTVKSLAVRMASEGRLVAAICAAPAVALAPFGVLNGRCYTCYPDMEAEVPESAGAVWQKDLVVVDGNVVTSRGPGTAGAFGFALVDFLLGKGASAALKEKMLY